MTHANSPLAAAAFLTRAKVWFAAHGINHIHRVVTDNGACHRSGGFRPDRRWPVPAPGKPPASRLRGTVTNLMTRDN